MMHLTIIDLGGLLAVVALLSLMLGSVIGGRYTDSRWAATAHEPYARPIKVADRYYFVVTETEYAKLAVQRMGESGQLPDMQQYLRVDTNMRDLGKELYAARHAADQEKALIKRARQCGALHRTDCKPEDQP